MSKRTKEQILYEYTLTVSDEGLIFKEYVFSCTHRLDATTYVMKYNSPYMQDTAFKVNKYKAYLADELNEEVYANVLLTEPVTEANKSEVIDNLKSAIVNLLKEEKRKLVAYYDTEISKILRSEIV